MDKKLERFAKTTFKLQDAKGISAIEPIEYQQRFCKRAVMEVFEGIEDMETKMSRKSKKKPEVKSDKADSRFVVAPMQKNLSNTRLPAPDVHEDL